VSLLGAGWVQTGSGTNNTGSTTTFTIRLANKATLTYEFATFDADTALTLGTFLNPPPFVRIPPLTRPLK
jgi:TRAP-type uncharacterized transport system fused permease subunit